MKAEDRAYYSNRAAAERNLAAAATDEQVAKIHREIAERYETLIADGVDQVTLLIAEDTGKFTLRGRS